MKAQIVSSHHSIMIEGFQIDLIYNFSAGTLDLYIDGVMERCMTFRPNYSALSYSNIIEVAVYYFEIWKRECVKRHNQEKKELGLK